MKLGLFGGTFDPIHWGHLLTTEMVRQALHLDQLLFIPAGDPPHKQEVDKTPAYHRWQMLQLAITSNPHFVPCNIDIERPGPHYSTDTVRLIREKYDVSAANCFFIIGADSLENLTSWHKPAELIQLCRLVVMGRPGHQPNMAELETVLPGLEERVDWVDTPLIELSATTIRQYVRQGRSIHYLVTDEVRRYIETHQLYQ